VKNRAKVPFAGSNEGPGNGRGFIRGLLVTLALALLLLALVASPAPADEVPTGTVSGVSGVPYTSAHLTGIVDPFERLTYYGFEYSTDQVNWTRGPTAYFGGNPAIAANSGSTAVSEVLSGLQPGTEYFVRIGTYDEVEFTEHFSSAPYVSFTAMPVTPPVVSADAPSVTATSAHLSGSVTAGNADSAFDSNCHFDYVAKAQFLIEGFASAQTIACSPATVTGTTATPVEADLHGLAPNSEYAFELVATNEGGTSTSEGPEFSTSVAAPGVMTGPATAPTVDAMTIQGSVNPFGLATTFHFEYGPTSAYGFRVPVGPDAPAGTGRNPRQVLRRVSGLTPGVTYHYRLVAESSAGRSPGADQTFTTPTAEPARAFELVSPPDKGGSPVSDYTPFFEASPDGETLAYPTTTAINSSELTSLSAPLFPRYLATRTESGWRSVGLDVPQPPASSQALITFGWDVLGVSEDGSHSVVMSLKALAPGAIEGSSNIYLLDNISGQLTSIATSPGIELFKRNYAIEGVKTVIGGTPDFSQVLLSDYTIFSKPVPFIPGTPQKNIYEWTGSKLRVASIQENGEPFAEAEVGTFREHEPRFISADGSTIFFNAEGKAWARVDGAETVAVSPTEGQFVGASRDGHLVFSVAESKLYSYNLDSRELTELAQGVNTNTGSGVGGVIQVSQNGEYVYFFGPNGIELWHDGQISGVAPVAIGDGEGSAVEYLASPSGRFLAFSTFGQPTGFDNRSPQCPPNFGTGGEPLCSEVYRYDAESGEVVCASCRRDGAEPTGDARFAPPSAHTQIDHHFSRAMLDNGELIFTTPDSLSAADTNGSDDVYSFDGGSPTLISAGKGSADSIFVDAGTDGRNIFFRTADRLVGADTDDLVDVYDARVGGGIASQNPAPPRGQCSGEDCRGGAVSTPAPPVNGSEAFSGPGNPSAPVAKRCLKRGTKKVKGGSRCQSHRKKAHGRRKARGDRRHGR
jgi:hypothetical protein